MRCLVDLDVSSYTTVPSLSSAPGAATPCDPSPPGDPLMFHHKPVIDGSFERNPPPYGVCLLGTPGMRCFTPTARVLAHLG